MRAGVWPGSNADRRSCSPQTSRNGQIPILERNGVATSPVGLSFALRQVAPTRPSRSPAGVAGRPIRGSPAATNRGVPQLVATVWGIGKRASQGATYAPRVVRLGHE